MGIQILLVGLFAFNLLLIWLLVFHGRFNGYKYFGLLIFCGAPGLSVFLKQPRFELDFFWWRLAGYIFILIGLVIFIWAQMEFRKAKTPLIGAPTALVTTGPYQLVRHPHYLAALFFMVGWWWIWAAVYSFYFGMFILALLWVAGWLEEKLILEKQFGDQYIKYKRQTGMFWVK